VGAPPAALALHKSQTLDANEGAQAMEANAAHLLEDLRTFAADGIFSRAEVRHARGHAALQHQLAQEQCSILKWAWLSLVAIERLIEGYRARIQEAEKAAREAALS